MANGLVCLIPALSHDVDIKGPICLATPYDAIFTRCDNSKRPHNQFDKPALKHRHG